MRKETFYKNLQPMIDQGLIMKQENIGKGTFNYTTQMNETVMLDLARRAEISAKAELTRAKKEQQKKQNGKSADAPVFLSNELKHLNKTDKDLD